MDIQKLRNDAYRHAAKTTPGGTDRERSSDVGPQDSGESPASSAPKQSKRKPPAGEGRPAGERSEGSFPRLIRREAQEGVAGETSGPASGGSSGKVAKLLMLLGRDEAARVLSHLSEKEIEAVVRQIAATGKVDEESAAEVLSEFGFRMETRPSTGGRETARSILTRAFGPKEAEGLLARALGERRRFFSFLSDLDARQVRALIKDESPAVISVLLSHMDAQAAAAVVAVLPEKERTTVIRRMATLRDVDEQVLDRVEASLRRKVESVGSVDSERIDGRSTLAEIMRHMDHQSEEALLHALGQQDAELVGDIEDRLFTIDSLLLIDDRQLAEVLSGYQDEELAVLLKGKDEEIRRKVLQNLSERRRAMVAEEYRFLGPIPKKDVLEATARLVSDLRSLEAEGRLVVRRDGEKYI